MEAKKFDPKMENFHFFTDKFEIFVEIWINITGIMAGIRAVVMLAGHI